MFESVLVKVERFWRFMEGLHTAIWLWTLPAVGGIIVGFLRGIDLWWLVMIPPIFLASVVYLSEKLYWQFGYCPLPKAAGIVFHDIRDTRIGGFMSVGDNNAEHLLNSIGSYIFSVVPVFGKRPPSPTREQLPEKILTTSGIVGGASRIRPHGNNAIIYDELEIRKTDIRRAIKLLRGLDAAHS